MDYLDGNSFTAYVGIDWGNSKHDICVQAAGSTSREFDCIPHRILVAHQKPAVAGYKAVLFTLSCGETTQGQLGLGQEALCSRGWELRMMPE